MSNLNLFAHHSSYNQLFDPMVDLLQFEPVGELKLDGLGLVDHLVIGQSTQVKTIFMPTILDMEMDSDRLLEC